MGWMFLCPFECSHGRGVDGSWGVGAHVSWGLGAHGARGVGMVEMGEVRVGFGFMLSRTEVLARLMVGPVIRHCLQCRMPVPTIRPKEITPASRPVLKECRHPPRRTSVVCFQMGSCVVRR